MNIISITSEFNMDMRCKDAFMNAEIHGERGFPAVPYSIMVIDDDPDLGSKPN